jgi:hypothetical protein
MIGIEKFLGRVSDEVLFLCNDRIHTNISISDGWIYIWRGSSSLVFSMDHEVYFTLDRLVLVRKAC